MRHIVIFIICCQFSYLLQANSKFTSIESFLRGKISDSGFQKYEDKVTNAHELTHVLHSELRQKYCNAGQNCFMLPDNKIYILQEPDLGKSSIAHYLPRNMQGKHFDHYVLKSVDWESYPSYLIDEWIAYYRGAQAGIEVSKTLRSNRDVFSGLVELAIYSNAILIAMQQEDPKFYYSVQGQNYQSLISKMNENTLEISKKIMSKPNLFIKQDKAMFHRYLDLTQKKTSLIRGSKSLRL